MARTGAAALQRALSEGRRSAPRFDVRLTLRYAAMRRGEAPITGTGESVNISRTGMLFHTTGKFHNDDSLIVVLDWPFLAPNGEPLKLVLTGQVVRTKRPLIGMAIHGHRLLREREMEQRFESFWGPAERVRQQHTADPRPTVLVDEDDLTAMLVSIIVSPHNWRIERVDPDEAIAILEDRDSPVRLVVTRTIDVFQHAPEAVPAVLIAPEGVELTETVAERPGRAVLHKPIKDADLRAAMGEARGAAPSEDETAGSAV